MILSTFLTRVRGEPCAKGTSVDTGVTTLLFQVLLPFRVVAVPCSEGKILEPLVTMCQWITLTGSTMPEIPWIGTF